MPPASSTDTSKFFIVQANGKVASVRQQNEVEFLKSSLEIKRLAFASQPPDILYGVASDLKVYVWISEPVSPIRLRLETYENERWTPARGYSDSLLPTDRWQWSDASGRVPLPTSAIDVPSEHWEWEGRGWEIDQSLNGELLFPEGWTYAVDFPSTYTPDKRWNSMVRRRKWFRCCRYRATNRWARMITVPSLETDLIFTDISAGAFDTVYNTKPPVISVWGITVNNHVYFREDCQISNAFHGTCWKPVELPMECEAVQISCGPMDSVWVVLSKGWALARMGICRESPSGTGWCTVDPPGPGGSLLKQVAVGPSSVWALSVDGHVWFRQGLSKSDVSGVSWIKIMDSSVTCVSVTRNNQLFALSSSPATENQILWRSGISMEDPHGKRWRHIDIQMKDHVRNGKDDAEASPWIWITATAGFVDPCSIQWKDDDEWKNGVLEKISQRNEKERKGFESFEKAVEPLEWTHSGKVRVWSYRHLDWDDCSFELTLSVSEDQNPTVSITGKLVNATMSLSDLTSVLLSENPREDQELWVFSSFSTRARTPLRLKAARDDLKKLAELLSDQFAESVKFSTLPRTDVIWILAPGSGCPLVSATILPQPMPSIKWLPLGGHFAEIESASGVTWAVGQNGQLWIWTGSYSDRSGLEKKMQVDTHVVEVYENQRWNPIEGYSATPLPSDRWLWSDESGRQQLSKDSFQLPSPSWKWESDWQIDWTDTDEEGWRYAFDFPSSYHGKKLATDYVRRRKWWRQMRVENYGPFVPGPTARLNCISICGGVQPGQIIPVWAITTEGHVLVRDRVRTGSPQGESWIPVKSPTPFASVSVGRFCVWAVSEDGVTFVRNGTQDKMDGLYWFQVDRPNDLPVKKVQVGGNVVWAITNDGSLFFRRDFSAAFPEGTEWMCVETDVLDISVSQDDQLLAVMRLPDHNWPVLARRTGVRQDDLMGRGWEYGIYAEKVSCRGHFLGS